jgi:Ca2+-binding RTX toxin-like protein
MGVSDPPQICYFMLAEINNFGVKNILNFNGVNMSGVINGTAGDDVINGVSGDTVYGNGGDDTLTGSYLDGGVGADVLNGVSTGTFFVVDSPYDEVNAVATVGGAKNVGIIGANFDASGWSGSGVSVFNGMGVILDEARLSDALVFSRQLNIPARNVIGNENANIIKSAVKASIYGRGGDDTLIGGISGDLLQGDEGNDSLSGLGGGDNLNGGLGNDVLDGGAGNDLLEGGVGVDSLIGGAGNDTYTFRAGDELDSILEFPNTSTIDGGVDTIVSEIDVDLVKYSNVENIKLVGSFNLSAVGNGSDNVLESNAGAGRLYGGGGNDTLIGGSGGALDGGAGNDVYVVNSASTSVSDVSGWDVATYNVDVAPASTIFVAPGIDRAILGGQAALNLVASSTASELVGNDANNRLVGGAGGDTLTGGAGDDVLLGGPGYDFMYGGSGNDTYQFSRGDEYDEILDSDATSGNFDKVVWTDLVSSDLIDLQLNAGALTFSFNSGSRVFVRNFINGVTGAVSLESFQFSNGETWSAADVLSRVDNAGTDGNDMLIGATDATNRIVARGGQDSVYGGKFNDTLDGGAGNDQLFGNEGNDSVIGGVGLDLLDGGAGKDTLDGGTGADTLVGGAGADLYFIDDAKDVVTEQAGNGRDSVRGSYSFVVPDNIEVGGLLGTANLNLSGRATEGTQLYGNTGNNLIQGGSGSDLLFGNLGADTLIGGAGSDIYQLFGDADTIVENADDDGIDVVVSTLSHTELPANIEYLVMTTGFADTANGSDDDNVIIGNDGANLIDGRGGNDDIFAGDAADEAYGGAGDDTLNGQAGDDLLNGGAGDDTLMGGAGDDTYVYSRGEGVDTIVDADVVGNHDVLSLNGIRSDQLWLTHDALNLVIQRIGTSDKVTIQGWYAGKGNQIELISANGKSLSNDRVEGLVQAMSTLTPPAAGQTTLPANYQTQLAGALTTAWV